ncbi:hypothetical protein K458DRAFT_388744 [Lentithecium fluviatile CBS 122367]|uniref:Uncharacterized protein n=1 Tax=Lentithecium fluviatile CBS 122367 TaxID=1168545 RepID=A0A6G1J2A6_9PLEO|nr:hypothetical protein K458DRAFT_388744 [Lentithecium fluviatile CBS 122367]
MLQTAFQDLSQNPHRPDDEILYGGIRVLFIAQLDPSYYDEHRSTYKMHRPSLNVAETIHLIDSIPFGNLDEQAFNKSHGNYDNFTYWCEVLKHLIRKAPFMFKTGTCIQLFASLLLGGELLQAELAAVGIEETFLNLRDFFRGLKPDQDEEKTSSLVGSVSNDQYDHARWFWLGSSSSNRFESISTMNKDTCMLPDSASPSLVLADDDCKHSPTDLAMSSTNTLSSSVPEIESFGNETSPAQSREQHPPFISRDNATFLEEREKLEKPLADLKRIEKDLQESAE